MKKFIFILTVIALICLSISGVSALDNQTVSESHIDDLANKINLTNDGDVVNLDNNY